MIGAPGLRNGKLFVARSGCDHRRPSILPISTAASPTPPPAPCTSSTSPGLKTPAVDQRVIGGAVAGQKSRAFGIVEIRRQAHKLRRRGDCLIGGGAVPHLDDHAVASSDTLGRR